MGRVDDLELHDQVPAEEHEGEQREVLGLTTEVRSLAHAGCDACVRSSKRGAHLTDEAAFPRRVARDGDADFHAVHDTLLGWGSLHFNIINYIINLVK